MAFSTTLAPLSSLVSKVVVVSVREVPDPVKVNVRIAPSQPSCVPFDRQKIGLATLAVSFGPTASVPVKSVVLNVVNVDGDGWHAEWAVVLTDRLTLATVSFFTSMATVSAFVTVISRQLSAPGDNDPEDVPAQTPVEYVP